MADKDLDALTLDLRKAAVATAGLAVAQAAARKVTDQMTASAGVLDKQLARVVKDVEALTIGFGALSRQSGRAAKDVGGLAERFDGLVGKLAPLSSILKDVGDRLDGVAIVARQGAAAINIHNEALIQLQSTNISVVSGQGAVSEALGKTEAAADKSSEKLRKVHETAQDLGGAMIDTVAALASGEAPMKVLSDKGGDVAKMLLKARLDGVSLAQTLKSLGLATGILQVATTGAAAAHTVNAASAGVATAALEAQTVAATELAVAESVALAPLGLILAGIAATAGVVAGVFAVAAHDIRGEVGDLTKDMGLTAEQLDRVKDKSVTMGDVAKATFELLARRASEVFGPTVKMIGDVFSSIYHTVTNVALKAVAYTVGAFVGAFEAIRASWSMLPAAIGDLVISAVQIVLNGVERMINGAIGLANGMIGKINGLAQKLGISLKIPELGQVELGEVVNQFAGAAKSAGQVAKEAFGRGFDSGSMGVLSFPKEVRALAIDVAEARIAGQAGNAPEAAGVARAETAKAARDNAKAIALETEAVAAANVVWPEAAAIAEAYAKQQKAKGEAQGADLKTMKDLVGGSIHLSSAMESLAIDFENAAKISDRMSGAVTGVADAFKNGDWAGAFGGLFSLLDSVQKAFAEGASSAEKFAAVTGLVQGVGKVVGGKAGAAISGAASGAQAGFQMGGPWGAAVGAALGGVAGLLGGASARAQAKVDAMLKAQQDLQAKQMESTDSVRKALEIAGGYQNSDLDYSNAMLAALRSIDSQIGAFANAVSRSIGASGLLDTTGLGLGIAGSGGLFGSKTKTELVDQGLVFDPTTYGAIATGGVSGLAYVDLVSTKTKKFLGVTTSAKVTASTTSSAVGGDLLDQVASVIQTLGAGVVAAAKAFGDDAGEAARRALDVVSIDLGKLSLKDLKPDEIEAAINAMFARVGDQLAAAGVPGLSSLAKVGEGAFETLTRLATEYKAIDTALASIGMTFKSVGVQSLGARDGLVKLFGGLEAFTSQTAFFAENFLSEDERLKPVKDSVGAELKRLGQPADLTRDGFKAAVLGQDLSTEAGAKLYAALMALAPAFDKVTASAEAAKAAVEDKKASILDQIDDLVLSPAALLAKSRAREMEAVEALDAALAPLLKNLWGLQDAAQAAKLATDRSNMLADLMDAQGRTEEAKQLRRSLALAQIQDPEQRGYQQQIWAAEDAAARVSAARDVLTQAYQREQAALQETKDKFEALSKSLRAFSANLSDSVADPATRYRRTRETFLTTAALARMGNVEAMGRLQAEGEAFSAASRDYAATSLDYLRDVGLVRSAIDEAADTADRQATIAEQQLEALEASVAGLLQINGSVISVQQAIVSLQSAMMAARAAGVAPGGGSTLGGVGKYGGLLTDQSSNAALKDGKFVPGDLYDPDFHDDLRAKLDAQRAIEDAKTPEQKAAEAAQREAAAVAWAIAHGLNPATGMPASLSFATGGGFEVGGSGPPDSKLFNLALSPGEAVNVTRADKKGDQPLIRELRALRQELADLRSTSARIATSNDKMERTLSNVTEGGRAMQTQAAA